MSVNFKSPATSANLNEAFVSKKVDSEMEGVLSLDNDTSGDKVDNVQQKLNDQDASILQNEQDINDTSTLLDDHIERETEVHGVLTGDGTFVSTLKPQTLVNKSLELSPTIHNVETEANRQKVFGDGVTTNVDEVEDVIFSTEDDYDASMDKTIATIDSDNESYATQFTATDTEVVNEVVLHMAKVGAVGFLDLVIYEVVGGEIDEQVAVASAPLDNLPELNEFADNEAPVLFRFREPVTLPAGDYAFAIRSGVSFSGFVQFHVYPDMSMTNFFLGEMGWESTLATLRIEVSKFDIVLNAENESAIWNANQIQGRDMAEPDESSMLDVESTTRGSRPFPRMTEAQRDAIASPATGLMVYNTDEDTVEVYNGMDWIGLSGATQWEEDGDDIYYDKGNVGIGTDSPQSALDVHGVVSTFGEATIRNANPVHQGSLFFGNGGANLNFVGGSDAQFNTGVGINSMLNTTTGARNTAIGRNSLRDNTTGSENTANGNGAMVSNTTGGSNTAVGSSALRDNTSTSNNTAVGSSALLVNEANSNTAVGAGSLRETTTGRENAALGRDAGRRTNAGAANATTRDSVYVGFDSRSLADGSQNEIVIGHQARGHGTNTVTVGNTSTTKNVFYGDVEADAFIGDGSQLTGIDAGGGGGGGAKNFMENGDAESGLDGWQLLRNTTDGAEPTPDAAAGTVTGVTFEVEDSPPLAGTQSFKITKDAADRQGHFVLGDMLAIDNYLIGKKLWVSSVYLSTLPADTIVPFIWNKTEDELVPLTRSGTSSIFQGSFHVEGSAGVADEYQWVFHIAGDTASAGEFIFDEVVVTPDAIIGAGVSRNEVIDVAGSGEFNAGKIRVSLNDTGQVTINLLETLTFASNNNPISAAGLIPEWARPEDTVNNLPLQFASAVFRWDIRSDGSIQLWIRDWSGSDLARTDSGSAGYTISYNVPKPAQAMLSTTETLNEAAKFSGTHSSSVSFPDNTTVEITINQVVWDTSGTFDPSENGYRIPDNGYYRLHGSIGFSGGSEGERRQVEVSVNGSTVVRSNIAAPTGGISSGAGLGRAQASKTMYLQKDDLINLRGYVRTSGTVTSETSPNDTFLEVIADPDLSVYGAPWMNELAKMPEVKADYEQRSVDYSTDEYVPIVASGSNSDGNWVRYADGTQMCWANGVTFDTNQSAQQTHTLPVNFLAAGSASVGGGDNVLAQDTFLADSRVGVTTTTWTIRNRSASGSVNNVSSFQLFAIGTWR